MSTTTISRILPISMRKHGRLQRPRTICEQWEMKTHDMTWFRRTTDVSWAVFQVHGAPTSWWVHVHWALPESAFPVMLRTTTEVELGSEECVTLERNTNSTSSHKLLQLLPHGCSVQFFSHTHLILLPRLTSFCFLGPHRGTQTSKLCDFAVTLHSSSLSMISNEKTDDE